MSDETTELSRTTETHHFPTPPTIRTMNLDWWSLQRLSDSFHSASEDDQYVTTDIVADWTRRSLAESCRSCETAEAVAQPHCDSTTVD